MNLSRVLKDRVFGAGKTRFDDISNHFMTFIKGGKGTFHCVERELLKIGDIKIEKLGCEDGFLRHGGAAHQAVVGVQTNAKSATKKDTKGMLLEVIASAGMKVAGKTHLHWYPPV